MARTEKLDDVKQFLELHFARAGITVESASGPKVIAS
jgi:hypothetical protein